MMHDECLKLLTERHEKAPDRLEFRLAPDKSKKGDV